jgi:hypothetical protein
MDIRQKRQLQRIRKRHSKFVTIRLDGKEYRINYDASARLAYGLCKKYGIDTKGMSPKEAWEALKEKTGKEQEEFFSESKSSKKSFYVKPETGAKKRVASFAQNADDGTYDCSYDQIKTSGFIFMLD